MAYPTKVTQEVVDLAGKLLVTEGQSTREVAKRLGVSVVTVRNIRNAGFNLENYRKTRGLKTTIPMPTPRPIPVKSGWRNIWSLINRK